MPAEPRDWKWSKSFYMGGEKGDDEERAATWETLREEHIKTILETPPAGLYKSQSHYMLVEDGVVKWNEEKIRTMNDDIARVFLYNVCENFKSLNNLKSL